MNGCPVSGVRPVSGSYRKPDLTGHTSGASPGGTGQKRATNRAVNRTPMGAGRNGMSRLSDERGNTRRFFQGKPGRRVIRTMCIHSFFELKSFVFIADVHDSSYPHGHLVFTADADAS